MTDAPEVALRIRRVRHHKARIDHHFMRGGVVRRYVVLESKELRDVLDKPRRVEIDPIDRNTPEAAEMTSGDIWEMAVRTAKSMLRELYAKVAEAKKAKHAQQLAEQREATQRKLGQQLIPTLFNESAEGTLIFAGVRPGAPYCVELLSAEGDVRRIEGLDLARALEVSNAGIGEFVCVTKVATNKVEILEQRTGSHGDGTRKHKRSRVIFEITKEVNHEPTDNRRKHGSRSRAGGDSYVGNASV
jgi:hypothetical protein